MAGPGGPGSDRHSLVLAPRAERARGGSSAMNGGSLLHLIVVFASLSLLSFGGTNTVLPEMHRQSVSVNHWLTDLEFASVFAISQASPGPSSLIVSLVGYKAAGWIGVLVATLAMFTPSAVLTFAASLAWERFR